MRVGVSSVAVRWQSGGSAQSAVGVANSAAVSICRHSTLYTLRACVPGEKGVCVGGGGVTAQTDRGGLQLDAQQVPPEMHLDDARG